MHEQLVPSEAERLKTAERRRLTEWAAMTAIGTFAVVAATCIPPQTGYDELPAAAGRQSAATAPATGRQGLPACRAGLPDLRTVSIEPKTGRRTVEVPDDVQCAAPVYGYPDNALLGNVKPGSRFQAVCFAAKNDTLQVIIAANGTYRQGWLGLDQPETTELQAQGMPMCQAIMS